MLANFSWFALLTLLGALSPLAFAPYDHWWLAPLQFLTLFIFLEKQTKLGAFKAGWFFGFGWFASGISWVHVSIDQFGGLPLAISLSMMAALSAYLALFFATATWLASRFGRICRSRVLLIAPAWALTEWLRSWLLTGFPWLSIGYSQIDSPLAGLFPIIGEYGVSVLLVFALSLLAYNLVKVNFTKLHLLIYLVLAGSTLASNQIQWYQLTGNTSKLVLVQGNIAQENRWAPEHMRPTMMKYTDMSRPYYKKADVIIWPEAAVPTIEKYAEEFLYNIDNALSYQGAAMITGVVDYDFDNKRYFNSLIGLGKRLPQDQSGHYQYAHSNRYLKYHLLPIGEFVPFEELLRPIAPFFDLPHSSFTRGEYIQPNMQVNGFAVLPAICYEIVFPDQIRANLTGETDFILTVSNDAWFGDSVGPHQHFQIARMRALEFATPVVRVTNNGITAVINAQGDVVARAPQFEDAIVQHELKLSKAATPYWHLGNWPIIITLAIGLILVSFNYYQRRTRRLFS